MNNIDSKRPITKYKILNSNLPSYFTIYSNGSASLNGDIQISDGSAPVWNNTSFTYNYSHDDEVDIQLSANSTVGTEIFYGIYRGQFPLGLELDSINGTITGTINPLISPENRAKAQPFYDSELPTWITNTGTILSEKEGTTISTNISATPNKGEEIYYQIVNGDLPLGLEIDYSTGTIAGHLNRILNPNERTEIIVTPKPRWNSPTGKISILTERVDYTYQLSATPRNGSNLVYFIYSGSLPYGLELSSSGLISGNTGEVLFPEQNEVIHITNPQISTPSMLGDYNIGDTIDIQLSTTVATGRTVSHYSLYDCDGFVNTLPLGLEIDAKNGRIFGTLHNINNVGTYTFTIVVYDSVMLSSCQIMNLVVTE